jgi:hypothetical protein
MIGATLALALGASFLAAFRLSGSPGGAGVLVFLGACLVAIGCAMQIGAILDRVVVAGGWRWLLTSAAWALVASATGWAILRAPGPELLTGVLTVPPIVGVVGVMVCGDDRGRALGFLAVALGLSVLLIPAALERLRLG